MSTAARNGDHHNLQRPQFECIALLLQGGGALGAYQAGVYEALDGAGIRPDWVAGISIGAINSAIIAGNAPDKRVEKLRQFWNSVSIDVTGGVVLQRLAEKFQPFMPVESDATRLFASRVGAGWTALRGVAGFFVPRVPSPLLYPHGASEATSLYDMSSLRQTLESLVDFDRINSAAVRFSVGAVNVRNGNFAYFDTMTHTIRPEHVMASGALPPSFAAIEIEGDYYWDGGLVSNTPFQWVMDSRPRLNTLAFQVDLWSARGSIPGNLNQVETRRKDIVYSSRTRAGTDSFKYAQRMRNTVADLLDKLPEDLKNCPEAEVLKAIADRKGYNIVHLIYRARKHEGHSKDYDFSRSSMEAHWRAGYNDTIRTLRHPKVLEPPSNSEGVVTFDLESDGQE